MKGLVFRAADATLVRLQQQMGLSFLFIFFFSNHFQINRCEGSKGKCSTELFLKSSYVPVPICLTMIRMGGKAIFPVVGES